MNKSIDLFIKSFKKDFWLLYLTLESIKRNVTGYNKLILLIPEAEKELFDTRNLPDRTEIHYVQEYGDKYLLQQVFKLQAYKYSYAEYIMFTDSDCFWVKPINLQDVVLDKPEILCTPWSEVGDGIVWKEPTEKFIGEEVEFERMRRNQMCFLRSTLVAISEYAPNLEQTVMESDRFSEFNCMAAYAYKYEKQNYTFTDTREWTYIEPIAEQVWSHASKEKGQSETHHLEYIRILETILKTFNIIVP